MGAIELNLSPLKAWRDALWKRWVMLLGLVIGLEEAAILYVRVREGMPVISSRILVPAIGLILGIAVVVLRTSTKNMPDQTEKASTDIGVPGNGSIPSPRPPQDGSFPGGGLPPEEGSGPGELPIVPANFRTTERVYAITEPRSFIIPKEGYDSRKCADKAASHEQLGRYAVADGVSRSFLPARWAEILVTRFVGQQRDFENPPEFMNWLLACSNEWKAWAEQWIQETKQRGLNEDWDSRLQEGAQATFVGCSLIKRNGNTIARVFAVGDANFFLFHPVIPGEWECYPFPLQKPEDFSSLTDTLWTPLKRIQHAAELLKVQEFPIQPGDCIVLATDALARWILTPVGQSCWNEVLHITAFSAFWELVQRERQRSTMEVDDTTMLVIPIH